MTRHALGHTFNVTLLTVFAGASLTMPAGAQPVGVPDPAIAVARTIDIQCAPRAAWTMPEAPLSVVGSREGRGQAHVRARRHHYYLQRTSTLTSPRAMSSSSVGNSDRASRRSFRTERCRQSFIRRAGCESSPSMG